MNILSGNIFEGMRLILPEHRAEMKRYENGLTRRTMRQLSQHEWEDTSYIIGEAIESQTSVHMAIFGEYEDDVWIGVVEVYGNALCIVNEEWDDLECRLRETPRLLMRNKRGKHSCI